MRYLTPEIVRFFAEEAKMAFVAGPRQVGKTTLAKHLLHQAGMEAFYFNWDIESHRKAIIKNPEDFWERAAPIPSPRKPRIGLDEIHKYPRWKRFLKGFFDARGKDLEVLVTGSGRLDIYQCGGDSLLGRYHLYHLHKLCEAWTDWGYGDFALYYVRDREKREVDFLITDRRKPHALVETKLTASDVDSNLRYFADRLKPKYAVQVVREPGKFKSIFTSKGVMFAPATHFLSFI